MAGDGIALGVVGGDVGVPVVVNVNVDVDVDVDVGLGRQIVSAGGASSLDARVGAPVRR